MYSININKCKVDHSIQGTNILKTLWEFGKNEMNMLQFSKFPLILHQKNTCQGDMTSGLFVPWHIVFTVKSYIPL